MSTLDPRLTPARSDLAAAHLRGLVEADRFVEGRRVQVSAAVLDLKRRPRADAGLDTQLLFGETVQLYDESEGWAWVQAERDGYVGYAAAHGLDAAVATPTHRVVVHRTFVYPAPDMKQPVHAALPLDARVTLEDVVGRFARVKGGGFVVSDHLAPLDDEARCDVVATAERLVGTPYLWGGRSPLGIDCSGLVQLSFAMAGVALPRDTDMQETLGSSLPVTPDFDGLVRGDLVFWRGHVGVMSDPWTLVHANAHHMLVFAESLLAAGRRIAAGDRFPEVTSIRRFDRSKDGTRAKKPYPDHFSLPLRSRPALP